MTAPLLQTKLYLPAIRPELLPRPRLMQRLNDGLPGKLTLVSAPAGFGKTTLLSAWAHRWANGAGRDGCATSPDVCVAWMSLDDGDNDPARFLAYLMAALQRIDSKVGVGALDPPSLRSPPSCKELLTKIINQISARSDSGGSDGSSAPTAWLVMVFDDYHVITAREIHDAIEFMLAHLPQHLHLIIATRADPPLHLARLRGRGELTELRVPDLRFTPQEAAAFLQDVMRLEVSPEDISALTARTEGWIVGLQMAALSMQSRRSRTRDVSSFVKAFTGSHRFVLDYLVEEVLEHQSPALQEFLLRTSILERLTGSLCDALACPTAGGTAERATGASARLTNSGQATLEALERDNLFIVPLDDERRWYRYHRLFSDLLRQRLQWAHPDLELTLHRRASEWYERHDLITDAIDHALSARDFERAVELIERAAEPAWARSEVVTFLDWVQALPDDVVRNQPRLGVLYALALLMSTQPLDSVQSHLQEAERVDETGAVAGEIALVHALIAAYRGDTQDSALLARQALEQLPVQSLFLRSLAAGVQSLACLYQGDIPVATQALEEAASISRQAGNVMNTVLALCHLAELSYLQGRLHAAGDFYEQALEAATDGQGRHQPIACVPLVGLGELQREWGDLEAAKQHLTESIELSQGCGEIWVLSGHIVLAHVRQTQGDEIGARAALLTAQQIAARFDAMQADDLKVAMNQAWLSIMQGRLGEAEQWAQDRGIAERAEGEKLEEHGQGVFTRVIPVYEGIILARLRLAQGRPHEALRALEPLIFSTETAGWTRFLIEGLCLQALAHQAQEEVAQALAALDRALILAEPEGYVRLFLDEGEPMAELLHRAASQGIATEYGMRLLAVFEPSAQRQHAQEKTTLSAQPLVEPLTERELGVLRLLTTHLSSTEIGEELFIASSTVRSHIKSIYGKLNVHSRSDAVQRAEELGLL